MKLTRREIFGARLAAARELVARWPITMFKIEVKR